MKNIHNQNRAELAHYIIVFYTQESGNCFGNTGKKCIRGGICYVIKGAEATCVEIATEMKKCFRLRDMLNFNIL